MILPTDNTPADKVPPPAAYWNLAGSLYAYLYIELSQLQIDVIGESQLIGYPTQFPSVSMMDWKTTTQCALLGAQAHQGHLPPRRQLVETKIDGKDGVNVAAQAFITPAGRKLLLANKRDAPSRFPCPTPTRPPR